MPHPLEQFRPTDGLVDGARYTVAVQRIASKNGVQIEDDRVQYVVDAWSGEKMAVEAVSIGEEGANGIALAKMRSKINGDWVEHEGLDPVRIIVVDTLTVDVVVTPPAPLSTPSTSPIVMSPVPTNFEDI